MIPFAKPLLPSFDKLEPYLKRVDDNRYYSNTGPLALEYEARLSEMFDAPCVSASNATSALTACLSAQCLPDGSKVACPSWTFEATPASIIAAGHVPVFVDVGNDSVVSFPIPKVESVILVSPFGIRIEAEQYNIPIIIDAAAGFDSAKASDIPTVISTHATKAFGTGEGGFVVCKDEALVKKIRHILNFGFDETREIKTCGINGKLSEYHAAVGLASLGEWPEKKEKWLAVHRLYSKYLGTLYGDQTEYATATVNVTIPVEADPVAKGLEAMGVGSRTQMYGCHLQPAFAHFPRTELPNTEHLMGYTIHLPCYVDMTEDEVAHVVKCLREAVV